jgi:phosphoribosylaminoimidazole-succinocarboxamide synthase
MGLATFSFRDEYSIFDYGRMPDDIPFKGESLCRMAAYNFEQVAARGIKTHFVKSVSPTRFQVRMSRLLDPAKGEVLHDSVNFLVPLEIVFRNQLPSGSSLLKRFASGSAKPADFGLDHVPLPGERLARPIVDYSTKLEKTDRHLKRNEAQALARVSDAEMEEIERTALAINDFLNERADALGLTHADGKIECVYSPTRELLVADTFGTLDEDRFMFDGVHLSKQMLRDYYVKTVWQDAVEKKEAGLPYALSPPNHLPPRLLSIVSRMYQSVCEAWVGAPVWKDVPTVPEVVAEYRVFVDDLDAGRIR